MRRGPPVSFEKLCFLELSPKLSGTKLPVSIERTDVYTLSYIDQFSAHLKLLDILKLQADTRTGVFRKVELLTGVVVRTKNPPFS